jgi:hypothetical protein
MNSLMSLAYLRVGCVFEYQLPQLTPMVFIVRPAAYDRHRVLEEERRVTPDIPVVEHIDQFGNCVWRLLAPPGQLQLSYTARVEVPSAPDLLLPDLAQTMVDQLPYDVLPYTLPSRYCESDLFGCLRLDLYAYQLRRRQQRADLWLPSLPAAARGLPRLRAYCGQHVQGAAHSRTLCVWLPARYRRPGRSDADGFSCLVRGIP